METLNVTFDRLVQDFCFHPIQLRQVAVEHHTQATHLIDVVLDSLYLGSPNSCYFLLITTTIHHV